MANPGGPETAVILMAVILFVPNSNWKCQTLPSDLFGDKTVGYNFRFP